MGFNTVIHILNDYFHDIEKNPELLVHHIRELMDMSLTTRENYDIHGHLSEVKVMPSHHASEAAYYISSRNNISAVSFDQVNVYVEKGYGFEYLHELEQLERQTKLVKSALKTKLEAKDPLLFKAKKFAKK